MSEPEKRKKSHRNGAAAQKKARDGGGEDEACGKEEEGPKQTAVTDAEVDEFFAILKRIHVAVKYFNGRKMTEIESLEVVDKKGKEEEEEEEAEGEKNARVLDLNSDPGPDQE